VPRSPGRPRNEQADAAILGAALHLFVEGGAGAVSIEQVARKAAVTRATVYRRFTDRTHLLIAAVEAAYGNPSPAPEIHDLDHLLRGWADAIADPGRRRLLRRLYAAIDDVPQLAQSYRSMYGDTRDEARRAVFEQARDQGLLPPDTDVEVLLDVLTGAVWQHLATRPDSTTATEAEQYLRAVLHQAGHRPGR
jgi:AcrR family transcriptional regulator